MASNSFKRVWNTLPERKAHNQKLIIFYLFLANNDFRQFVAVEQTMEIPTQIMRSWLVNTLDTPVALGLVEKPSAGPNEVIIRVKATGLNFADLLMIKGTYQETPETPFSPGLEIAGEIIDLGAQVTSLRVGQRVAAYTGRGGLSEFVATAAERCVPLPDQMDEVTAAGFQIAYGTSHLALKRRARLKAGETLAVLGAAGGVGLTAVEIGKAMGAYVIAVARGRDRLEVARAAGADVLIDTDDTEDMRASLKEAGPLNVIYDAVGGDIGEASLRATAPEARYLIIGFASGDLPQLRPNHLLVKNTDVMGIYWGSYFDFAPEIFRESLSELFDWYCDGRIRPHVSHEIPFDDADQALELLRSRRATGKIVVTQ